jgi:hypothetical protein
MSGFWSRLFRSKAELEAERAEVEGRFDDAARLFVEAGQRDEAFRVLTQAAEGSERLSARRDWLTRANAIARTDAQRIAARSALASVTLSEFELRPPSSDEDRIRLDEASHDLERAGRHREAAAGFKLLADRDSMERCLVAAGDVEGFDREASSAHAEETLKLRRRAAIERFEGFWVAGDREGALEALQAWVREHPEDHEARRLGDERQATLIDRGTMEIRLDGSLASVIGAFPCTLGREAALVVRGAGVSREHATIERAGEGEALTLRDLGSRNGITLSGLPVRGLLTLEEGVTIGLGPDLSLTVQRLHGALTLVIDRGMDRGKRLVLLTGLWRTPVGTLTFRDGRALLTPERPVKLLGQRVVTPFILARGDRVDGEHGSLEVLR